MHLSPFAQDKKSRQLLDELLKTHRFISVFKKDERYHLPSGSSVRLTHTLVVRCLTDQRSDRCFFIVSDHLIGEGGFGAVFDLAGVVRYEMKSRCFIPQYLPHHFENWVLKAFNSDNYMRSVGRFSPNAYLSRLKEQKINQKVPYMEASPLLGEYQAPYLLLKKLGHDDLLSFILSCNEINFIESLCIGVSIVAAVQQIHRLGLVHGDIKPENFRVDFSAIPFKSWLVDFGLTQTIGERTPFTFGTVGYIAPEFQTQGGVIRFSLDIYALGCVLKEVFSKSSLFFSQPYPDPHLAFTDWRTLTDLVNDMCATNPRDRPMIDKVYAKFATLIKRYTSNSDRLLSQEMPRYESPYTFFSPKTIIAPLTEECFKRLLERSLRACEALIGCRLSKRFLAAIKQINTLEALVNFSVNPDFNVTQTLSSDSLICHFLKAALDEGALDKVKQALMIDTVEPKLLILDSNPNPNDGYLQWRAGIEHDFKRSNLERENLFSVLIAFQRYSLTPSL